MMKILILDDDDLFRPFLITLIESVFNESDIITDYCDVSIIIAERRRLIIKYDAYQ